MKKRVHWEKPTIGPKSIAKAFLHSFNGEYVTVWYTNSALIPHLEGGGGVVLNPYLGETVNRAKKYFRFGNFTHFLYGVRKRIVTSFQPHNLYAITPMSMNLRTGIIKAIIAGQFFGAQP